MAPSINKQQQLVAKGYFTLANNYLDVYQTFSKKIQDPTTPNDDKVALYAQSKPILQQAYEFQRMGFKALTVELNTPVEELQSAVDDAAKTIKNIFRIGKVIEIAADLVGIAAVLAVPVIKPVTLAVLPKLVAELKNDVQDLKS